MQPFANAHPLSFASSIKSKLKRSFPALTNVYKLQAGLRAGHFPIVLDYPVSPKSRYGWGKPAHGILHGQIAARTGEYLELLKRLAPYENLLGAIPTETPASAELPFWRNNWVMGLDAATLYAFPSVFHSKLYIEVGSGNSTKFVRRSIVDNHLGTRIVSIDPHPRAEIDALCDEVIRMPLETADLHVFAQLEANDILMIDNSHRCFQNSDVTVTFLDVLPRLNPGVLIYIDDIYLPYDYPQDWDWRYYSEQYLLATLLLADKGARYEILFPGFFFSVIDETAKKAAAEFWQRCGLGQFASTTANGFWMRVRAG